MAIFAVLYHYDATQAAQMDELRPAHRAFLRSLHESGSVKLVGSWKNDPHPGALVALAAEDADQALSQLNDDPFFTAGLIAKREVHEWNIIIGGLSQ